MHSFKQFTEAKHSWDKPDEHSEVLTPTEMRDHIGKTKFNTVVKHPWYNEHFGHVGTMGGHIGMKFVRRNGFESVHVAHSPIGTEGKKLRKMAEFHLNSNGRKIDNVHVHHNWNDERHDTKGFEHQLRWSHVKSLHTDEEKK